VSGLPAKPPGALKKGEKTMENGLRQWLLRRLDALKKSVLADMHRMASGWAGQELPAASMQTRARAQGKTGLKLSFNSRRKMPWRVFVHRLGH
jgi:hypothetical protein